MSKKVLIYGGEGAGTVIGEAIIDANHRGYNDCEFCGFINDRRPSGEIDGYPVLGSGEDVRRLTEEGYTFLHTIHKIGGQPERISLLKKAGITDRNLATFVHPSAYVAPTVQLSQGCAILANASVSSRTKVGKGTLIMSNVSIGHDNTIGEHCYFTANSCVGSSLTIGKGVWFGLNSSTLGKRVIGDYAAIGMGAVVTKDIGENELWVGNPARFHKHVTDNINM